MLNICSGFVGGSVQVGYNLDRPEKSVQVDSHVAQVQREADIWRRFGGGVRTGIALFWAIRHNLCTICNSCNAA